METNSQESTVFETLREWAQASDSRGIPQFKKDSRDEFTYATRNGIVYRFLAKLFNGFFSEDIYDRFGIGKNSRQLTAAQQFHMALQKNTGVQTPEQPTKLSVGYLRKYFTTHNNTATDSAVQLFDNPQNNTATDSASLLFDNPQNSDVAVTSNLEHDLQTAIPNLVFADLGDQEKQALTKVYNTWKEHINGATEDEQQRASFLQDLIKDSKPLLEKIIRSPDTADIYLDSSAALAHKLENFMNNSLASNDANIKQITSEAHALMGGFINASAEFSPIEEIYDQPPALGNCFLFPVFQAVCNLKNNQAIAANLQENKSGNTLQAFLQTASFFADEAHAKHNPDSVFIVPHNFADRSFEMLVKFEPIRMFLQLSEFGKAPVFQTDVLAAISNPDQKIANTNFAIAANAYTGKHSMSNYLANDHAQKGTYDYENIFYSERLQKSFNYSTGLQWSKLSISQKGRAGGMCKTLSSAAAKARLPVETYLQNMKPVIVKAMSEPEYFQKFSDVTHEASVHLHAIISYLPEETTHAPSAKLETLYVDYLKSAKLLLDFTADLNPRPSLESMAVAAAGMAVQKLKDSETDFYAHTVCSQLPESPLNLLVNISRYNQYDSPAVEVEGAAADPFSRQQILAAGPLLSLALQMHVAADPNASTAKEGRLANNPMDNEEFVLMPQITADACIELGPKFVTKLHNILAPKASAGDAV